MSKKVLILVGPTAVGKTDISIELARELNGEIISADSRQIYRFMNVGTAKPTAEQLAAVPHHFIDILNPDERYSAGRFAEEARAKIRELLARHKQPIVVGGSGLYIRALLDGLAEPKVADEAVKQSLKKRVEEEGLHVLFERLREVDAETAERLNATDRQRILRALEVYEITGEPYSRFIQKAATPASFASLQIGLSRERRVLYERIEKRVDAMLAAGFVEEVRHLQEMGYHRELNAMQTVGYKEVFMYLSGELEYDSMVALIKQKSRNYAKRQMTWFRKDSRIAWLDLDRYGSSEALCDAIKKLFLTRGERG